jgi:hypothetical protein
MHFVTKLHSHNSTTTIQDGVLEPTQVLEFLSPEPKCEVADNPAVIYVTILQFIHICKEISSHHLKAIDHKSASELELL